MDELKRCTVRTLVCSITGSSLLLLGLTTNGSKVDRQEFCFRPEPLYEIRKVRIYDKKGNYSTKVKKEMVPFKEKYCQGERLYLGVSWRIAESIDENPELRKIHFKKKLPAKRPLAGWYTLTGSLLFFTAYLIWQHGTELYFQNLQRIIKLKETELTEESLKQNKDVELLIRKYKQETEYIGDLQDRTHELMMDKRRESGEKLYHQDLAQKNRELLELQHENKKAMIKAQTAEQQEKEAKHRIEIQKGSKSLSKSGEGQTKSSLKKLIKDHEGGWIYDLVYSVLPIVIYGRSGSYKSYTATCLTLLKHKLLNAQLESICDPQWHQNRTKAWKELISLEPNEYGEASNWNEDQESSYQCGIESLLGRCRERKEEDSPIISIWDELTKLGQYLPELSKVFMPEIVSSPRKANEHTILITHNITQAGLGNVQSMSETIKEGTFRLKLNGTNTPSPLFKGTLNGWVNSDGELVEDYPITLPNWFRPEKIKEMK